MGENGRGSCYWLEYLGVVMAAVVGEILGFLLLPFLFVGQV